MSTMSSYCLWSQWEFQTLLLVLVDLDVKHRLTRGAERCPKLFKEVARELARYGVQKSEKQALQKFRNLKTAYKHHVQRHQSGFPVNQLPLHDLQEKVFGTPEEFSDSCRYRGDFSPSPRVAGMASPHVAGMASPQATGMASPYNGATRSASLHQGLARNSFQDRLSTPAAATKPEPESDSEEFVMPVSVQLDVNSSSENHAFKRSVYETAGRVLRLDPEYALVTGLESMWRREQLLDVTLVCEGRSLQAHRVVLAAYSAMLKGLLLGHPSKHPIVILRDTPYRDMRSLLELMYTGRVRINDERHANSVFNTARSLQLPLSAAQQNDYKSSSSSSPRPSSSGFTAVRPNASPSEPRDRMNVEGPPGSGDESGSEGSGEANLLADVGEPGDDDRAGSDNGMMDMADFVSAEIGDSDDCGDSDEKGVGDEERCTQNGDTGERSDSARDGRSSKRSRPNSDTDPLSVLPDYSTQARYMDPLAMEPADPDPTNGTAPDPDPNPRNGIPATLDPDVKGSVTADGLFGVSGWST